MSSPKFHPEMSESLSAIMLQRLQDESRLAGGPSASSSSSGNNKDRLFPRTLSTSVLRIKHRSSFWERFWENHRRISWVNPFCAISFHPLFAILSFRAPPCWNKPLLSSFSFSLFFFWLIDLSLMPARDDERWRLTTSSQKERKKRKETSGIA